MNYLEKIDQVLKENMTERGFTLWNGIKKIIPNIWEKPSSSSGKYHKKENGSVPSIAEHTFEMIYAAIKLMRLFNVKKDTSMMDVILLSIVLHDSLKYGSKGDLEHTDVSHDKLIGDLIQQNEKTFKKLFNDSEFYILEEASRFHSGRWSTDARYNKEFDFKHFTPYTLFVHILDMCSTADLIKIWEKDLNDEGS